MKLLCVLACLALCGGAAQTMCLVDTHCDSDAYCADAIGVCTACVDCGLQGRAAAKMRDNRVCAKRQEDCGPCLQADEAMVDGWCGGRGAALPAWGVALLALVVIFVAVVVVLLLYLRRHSAHEGLSSETVVNGQPRAPPPYHPLPYAEQPPFSPLAPPPTPPHKRRSAEPAGGEVTEAERQDARPYHPPHWVRVPEPTSAPPSYSESVGPASPISDPDADNTAESVWSPRTDPQVVGSLSEQLRAARARPPPASPPPAKRAPAVTQDEGGASGSRPPPPADSPPPPHSDPIIIQIVNQMGVVNNL